MENLFLIVFWLTLGLCFLSYSGYPLIIWLAGILFPFSPQRQDIAPFVSVIIPAYNEEKDIARKVHNTLCLEYPAEKIEILIGSDGSTDRTAQIVQGIDNPRIRFFDFSVNRGKTAVQNDLVEQAHGQILVFTDAASYLQPDAVCKLVRNFADDRVGCVAGSMRFVNTEENLTTQSQGVYWRYEFMIRQLESKIGRLIGVDGPLYAVRRNCYVPLPNHIISDFLTPLLVLKQGEKVVLEPEALVYEAPTNRPEHEFTTRRRITVRGLAGLWHYKELLNFLKAPFLALQILLHKFIRWFVGPLVIINMMSAVILSSNPFFTAVVILYTALFLGALFGYVTEALGKKYKFLSIPYYFFLVNAAATLGIVDFFSRKQAVKWIPVRNSPDTHK